MDDSKVTVGRKRLVGPYDYGGWEVRTVAGLVLKIVADGVGLESDPRNFDSVVRIGEKWEEITLASIYADDVARLSSRVKMPYERPPSDATPLIVSDPIPSWRIELRDGVVLEIAADSYRPFGRWSEFSFRVADQGREWDEPVLFVRSKDLTSARVMSRPH